MSKRKNVGYIIELNPESRNSTYLGDNNLCDTFVFPTRKRARMSKRRFGGNRIEIIYQVSLDCNGRSVNIIKKVR